MVVVYLLICLVPVALILVVLGVIGLTAMKLVKAGKQAYAAILPDINDIKDKVTRAQRKGLEFSERGKKISEAFEEIGGRWAFISQSFAGSTNSPIAKLAGMAGKRAGHKGKD
jgi:hypothetical protein